MSVNPQNTKLDAGRFGDLHKAYHDRLVNSMTSVVRDRQAAEEITASAFAKALEHVATFRGEASFYTCYVVCSVMWCAVDVGVASWFKDLKTLTSRATAKFEFTVLPL